MSKNPPQSFHETFINTLGLRVYEINPSVIGSPNAISAPIPINSKLVKERNEIDPNYCPIKTDTDYSIIQNTIRGLANEILRFDDLEQPSNQVNGPRLEKTEQYLEM